MATRLTPPIAVTSTRRARLAFAATSLVTTAGLLLQLVLAATNEEGRFTSVPARIVNVLSFFTIQSNVLVAVTTGMLAVDPVRRGKVFSSARLTAVLAISITGIVYHLALADIQELDGSDAVADQILHTVSPIMAVAGWVVLGPRRRIDRSVITGTLVFPMLWLTYTLVRGALVEDRDGRPYYPYPFLDVGEHGYRAAAVSIVLIALLFVALALGVGWLDRVLPRPTGSALHEVPDRRQL